MRPFLLKVDVSPEQSFAIRNQVNPLFYNQWHFHAELELTYVRKGSGIRFVGDNIENFREGDLILLGSNLPHFWRADTTAGTTASPADCEATVVQFNAEFWGKTFLELPELILIRELLSRARRGLSITGETRQEVGGMMLQLSQSTGLQRILLLLQMLHIIAQSDEIHYLSSAGFNLVLNETDTDRIAKIYAFTLANFSRKITLNEVAALIHLTPNAFCRFFKTHTRKTYSRFLLEIRIGHTCKLLMDKQWSIGQICLESGFQNFSNFNRYFKEITKLTPQEYSKMHRKIK